MTDIATIWNPDAVSGDWAMRGPALLQDDGLRTAVTISLLTDRQADADDVLPDGTSDRRGWWGDMPLDGSPATDFIGSRLWLLTRAKAIEETRQRAIFYAREALEWLIEDGIAAAVTVDAQWNARNFLAMRITIARRANETDSTDRRFDLLWDVSLGRPVLDPAPAPRIYVTDESGRGLTDGSGLLLTL